MVKNVGIINCKRIQDTSCIGCSKCYKAINEKTFAFEREDDIRLVFKTNCGDCPGLVLPKLQLQMMVLKDLDTPVDEIYFATCVNKAHAMMSCPMNLDAIKTKIEDIFDVPVSIGTHEY